MLKWFLEKLYRQKIIGEYSKTLYIVGYDPAAEGEDKNMWVMRDAMLGCCLGATVGGTTTCTTNTLSITIREGFLARYYRELNEKIRRNR
jgi:hypothetical protein